MHQVKSSNGLDIDISKRYDIIQHFRRRSIDFDVGDHVCLRADVGITGTITSIITTSLEVTIGVRWSTGYTRMENPVALKKVVM